MKKGEQRKTGIGVSLKTQCISPLFPSILSVQSFSASRHVYVKGVRARLQRKQLTRAVAPSGGAGHTACFRPLPPQPCGSRPRRHQGSLPTTFQTRPRHWRG